MKTTFVRLAMAAAVVTGGLIAAPALASNPVAKGKKTPGSLVVVDTAKVFTEDGINKAKEAFAAVEFASNRVNLTVETFPEVPAEKKAAFDAATDKKKFYHDWAVEVYKSHKDKGLYVLICMKPGHVEVLPDRETAVGRDFSKADSEALANRFTEAFGAVKDKPDAEAKVTRDKSLLDGTEFVISQLKGTRVGLDDSGMVKRSGNEGGGGMGIMGWVCLGLAGLLGAWLVIGLIRAFSGGGAGGSGGGGFFPSLLGGLFGAVAGMWLYSHFFGGGGMFGGSDAYAGDAGGGDAGDSGGDTGAGDVDGDYGGGADFDGGGGDWGGGGDFGGGDF